MTPLRPSNPPWSGPTSPVSFTWKVAVSVAITDTWWHTAAPANERKPDLNTNTSSLVLITLKPYRAAVFNSENVFLCLKCCYAGSFTSPPDIFALVRYNSQNDSYRWVVLVKLMQWYVFFFLIFRVVRDSDLSTLSSSSSMLTFPLWLFCHLDLYGYMFFFLYSGSVMLLFNIYVFLCALIGFCE